MPLELTPVLETLWRRPVAVTVNNIRKTSMPFQPGQSGNPRGHPRGSRNKNSLGVKDWATRIVEDPEVQARLLADARTGKLHSSVLTVLMTYAYGRPNLRDVPEPETPITIELNIPKPPGVMRTDSTG